MTVADVAFADVARAAPYVDVETDDWRARLPVLTGARARSGSSAAAASPDRVDGAPSGVPEIWALLSGSGRAVPDRVEGLMRQQRFHLERRNRATTPGICR